MCPATFFLFIILLIQTPHLTFCDEFNSSSVYEACAQSFSCGDIDDIGYPFWGGSQPAYCGHPSFGLTCSDESSPEITILAVKYKVLGISSQAATIVRYDLSTNICPSIPQRASLDLNLFSYAPSGNQNITLFYGCTIVNPVSVPIPKLLNCSEEGSDSNRNNVLWSPTTGLPSIPGITSNIFRCGIDIFVTVTQEAFDSLVKASLNVTEDLLRTAVGGGFSVDWKANNTLCEDCTGTGGRCGSNGDPISTQFICYIANSSSSNKAPLLAIGLGIAGAALAGVGIGLLIFRQKRKWVAAQALDHEQVLPIQNIEAFVRTKGFHATKLYTYSDIKKMTNSFNDKIGKGGFGSVYRGKLPDGCPVAVKLLNNTKGNGEDFINEVASISRTSHVNIVTLVGFCYKKKRALVYEFMPNGSLDKYIGNKGLQNMSCLEWKTLYQIAIGIARGLEYLHRGCNTRIMHFDIKPNNILLDKDFTPKISDFGLAKLSKKKESVVSLSMYGARGTIGYIAPEVVFRSIGSVSHKSDVYSYGMTVIDMVGVRENVHAAQTSDLYFPNWIYEHLEQGLDFSLEGIRDEEDKEMAMKMILVRLWCIQTNPADRPSITKVVEMLEGSIESLEIPPKPFFCPPTDDSPQQSPTSSVTT
ncbi:PREDICTED: LEAF RUST 10 DISEASE-RESISTANCE LOCUS RECEPTOR-LIKE PROTEIN KINASE-like 2.5 [Ipomoea nil]|uniref:LEAF RUST 10 DISEASE-RESISTANCE LOCUS RECEPTOR-LIKE PROTEIN KINASE-like 2.5 n=1 Tax=Ipomoea nil TaxID=35883 RepID=UPI0009015471|nr:PREDICTED: LEAF RUST 10 DISEASE-RESISTANCE LOCUS RECEPTOR-LIKE PROTEIN KINASE-like 2.5 [Ipomoea nil]